MLSGFTLSYQGRKYTTDDQGEAVVQGNGLEKLKADFTEIGALVIRYHIGHGQRAGLLQQIARENYSANPVEKPGFGKNEASLFSCPENSSVTTHETRMLEECSHYSLGRGKLLNERAQPLVHVNSQTSGEQSLWDIMHSPVWGTGIAFAPQLNEQKFSYIICPEQLSTDDYNNLSAELFSGKFKLIESSDGKFAIETESGVILEIANVTELKVDLDPSNLNTPQENKLLITANNTQRPLGWIISRSKNKVINAELTDHIMRIIKISKGGFYELTTPEQQVLQSGLLKNNGVGLFTQNQVFNAMTDLFVPLEKDYGFDPSALLPERALRLSRKRINDASTKEGNNIVEDFLTGNIVTEMVQHLRVTQPKSVRTELPKRFTNPFVVTHNNAKAIAYAFEITDRNGKPVLELDDKTAPTTRESGLLDVKINGKLANPALNRRKNTACILSAAILVGEQMLLEQLLRDACVHGDNHEHAIALKSLLNDDTIYQRLLSLAKAKPANEMGPILGLQFSYCDEIIALLRKSLWGTDAGLIKIVDMLRSDKLTAHDMTKSIDNSLEKLFAIGEVLQSLNATSVRDHGSRGINAGVMLVIKSLSPHLHAQLVKEGRIDKSDVRTSIAEIPHHTHVIEGDVCPFFRQQNNNVPRAADKPKKGNDWCRYFTRKAIPAIVATAGVAAGYAITQLL